MNEVSEQNIRPNGRRYLIEITPVMFGGDPEDPKNKAWVTQTQHSEYVRFWNDRLNLLRLASQQL